MNPHAGLRSSAVSLGEQSRTLSYRWAFPLAIVTVPLGIGLIAEVATDFGHSVDGKFYELSAQILPVLAIALFLERGGILATRIAREGPNEQLDAIVHGHAIVVAGSLLVGETVALVAVAAGLSTTFLVVSTALTGLIQLVILAATTVLRVRQEGEVRFAEKQADGSGSV